MISNSEFGQNAMTASKQAMPESGKYDGPSGISTPGGENSFAAHVTSPIAGSGSGN